MFEGVVFGNLFFEVSMCICVLFGVVFCWFGGLVCDMMGFMFLLMVKGELIYDMSCVMVGYVDVFVICYFEKGLVVEFVCVINLLVINGGDGFGEYLS